MAIVGLRAGGLQVRVIGAGEWPEASTWPEKTKPRLEPGLRDVALRLNPAAGDANLLAYGGQSFGVLLGSEAADVAAGRTGTST
jgi:hypothetical protein